MAQKQWPGIVKLVNDLDKLHKLALNLMANPDEPNLVDELKESMAETTAIMEWFEYKNRLDLDVERIDAIFALHETWHDNGGTVGVDVCIKPRPRLELLAENELEDTQDAPLVSSA